MADGRTIRSTDIFRAITWASGLAALLFTISNLYFFGVVKEVRASSARARQTTEQYIQQEAIFKEILSELLKVSGRERAIHDLLIRSGYTTESVPDQGGPPGGARS